jgi:endoglucanase
MERMRLNSRLYAGIIVLLIVVMLAISALSGPTSRSTGHQQVLVEADAGSVLGRSAGVGRSGSLASQLFVDPNSQAATWVQGHPTDPRMSDIRDRIASQPTGKWFGAWSGDIESAVSSYAGAAAHAHRIPIMIAYNIPSRDCGGDSAGGMANEAAYNQWIDSFKAGLGNNQAIVILEPDALAELDSCLDGAGQAARLRMLTYAIQRLESPSVSVYLDAGHANWVPADRMAARLKAAGVDKASGFALNVANYDPINQEVGYAAAVNRAMGKREAFVIDSSRDGSGTTDGEWCNPANRRLGLTPQLNGPGDMLLWLKAPGESDGNCGIGAGLAAGQFSPDLAEQLITGASHS